MATHQWKNLFERVFELRRQGFSWMEAAEVVHRETGVVEERIRKRMAACEECRKKAYQEFGGFFYE